MNEFHAFSEAQSINIGDLTVESDEEQFTVYGKMDLGPNPASLEKLDLLIAVLSQARGGFVVAIANGDPSPAVPKALPTVPNPFA